MQCDIGTKLFSNYKTVFAEWKRAAAALPDPPLASWADHREAIEHCKQIHERVSAARAALEAHRKEHGC